jgi:hypothetical protein
MSDELIYDGECPICGEPFGDGFDDIDVGDQIDDVRICVIEKDGDAEIGESIIHLPSEVSGDD